MKVAEFLQNHPLVAKVNYPGLASHPQHELCKKQMNGLYTGIMSFELKDCINGISSLEAGRRLVNNLSICQIGVSLGDVDTLIEQPATMTHANVSEEERLKIGITDGLVRISVGLEDAKDIINDLSQSLDLLTVNA